jgi:hypothetical protein
MTAKECHITFVSCTAFRRWSQNDEIRVAAQKEQHFFKHQSRCLVGTLHESSYMATKLRVLQRLVNAQHDLPWIHVTRGNKQWL